MYPDIHWWAKYFNYPLINMLILHVPEKPLLLHKSSKDFFKDLLGELVTRRMQWSICVSQTIPIWLRHFYHRELLPWKVIPYLQWCCSRLYMTKWLLDEWYDPVFPSQAEIWSNCCTASTNIFVSPPPTVHKE